MTAPRVVLTAGHMKSAPSEALAELLTRDGVQVAGIVVVRVFNLARLRSMIRQRGLGAVLRRFREARSAGGTHSGAHARELPLPAFLRANSIQPVGLKRWAKSHNVPLKSVKNLNDADAIQFIAAAQADAVVYTGGGILRSHFINAVPPVLNAHAGPLPAIRGMNAAEWSALLGHGSESTVHFIDSGIDTGAAIAAFPYDRTKCRTVEEVRQSAIVAGIQGLRQVVTTRAFEHAATGAGGAASAHRQCFTMAPALLAMLEERLRA